MTTLADLLIHILHDQPFRPCVFPMHATVSNGGADLPSPELARAVMKFFVTERSDEQFAAFRRNLLECGPGKLCHALLPAHHPPAHLSVDRENILDHLLGRLGAAVWQILDQRTPGKYRRKRVSVSDESQPWPWGLADIAPNGPKSSLLRWASAPPHGYTMFKLIGSLARFCEPFGREVIRSAIPRLIVQHLKAILAPDVFGANPVIAFIHWFVSVEEMEPQAGFSMLNSVRDELVVLLPQIWAQRTDPNLDSIRDWLSSIAFVMHIPLDDNFEYQWYPASHTRHRAFVLMVSIRSRDRCMHLGCKNAYPSTPLPVCMRCGIVRYCVEARISHIHGQISNSRMSCQCQKPAWKAAEHPHKPLCDLIADMRKSLGMQDALCWKQLTYKVEMGRLDEFDEVCSGKDIDNQTVEAIGEEICALPAALNRRRGISMMIE
ncbi:hypothetical protein B0H10DRAFT_2014892 [Mycena sp. CBHHK59/15]|nr:hypothetical protein B0H10DRAFT_2014892 [Mycena sp. CBHHK59/15]